jgi:hypothetical protein
MAANASSRDLQRGNTVQRIHHAAKIMFLRGVANCGQGLK